MSISYSFVVEGGVKADLLMQEIPARIPNKLERVYIDPMSHREALPVGHLLSGKIVTTVFDSPLPAANLKLLKLILINYEKQKAKKYLSPFTNKWV